MTINKTSISYIINKFVNVKTIKNVSCKKVQRPSEKTSMIEGNLEFSNNCRHRNKTMTIRKNLLTLFITSRK